MSVCDICASNFDLSSQNQITFRISFPPIILSHLTFGVTFSLDFILILSALTLHQKRGMFVPTFKNAVVLIFIGCNNRVFSNPPSASLRFMPPDDPLGRHGPSLDNFLRKRPVMPEQKKQPCPYGENFIAEEQMRITLHFVMS